MASASKTFLDSLPLVPEGWKCGNIHHTNNGDHEVFISYRVACDQQNADALYAHLQNHSEDHGIYSVYLDRYCLAHGEVWRDGFLNGIRKSKMVVVLISHDTLSGFLAAHEKEDNMLLEIEVALALRRELQVQVVPVFIGKWEEAAFIPSADKGGVCDAQKESVLRSCFQHFQSLKFSSKRPLHPLSCAKSVESIMDELKMLQVYKNADPRNIREVAQKIQQQFCDSFPDSDEDYDEEDEEDYDEEDEEDYDEEDEEDYDEEDEKDYDEEDGEERRYAASARPCLNQNTTCPAIVKSTGYPCTLRGKSEYGGFCGHHRSCNPSALAAAFSRISSKSCAHFFFFNAKLSC